MREIHEGFYEVIWPDGDIYEDKDGRSVFPRFIADEIARATGGAIARAGRTRPEHYRREP